MKQGAAWNLDSLDSVTETPPHFVRRRSLRDPHSNPDKSQEVGFLREHKNPRSTRIFVLPPGFEPGPTVPKTVMISISPRKQNNLNLQVIIAL